MTSKKTLTKAFLFFALLATFATAKAQTVPDAYEGPFNIYAGGFGSFFKPDYPANNMYGAGTYLDIKFRKWVQVEAEVRWLEFNEFEGGYQIHYSVGPRLPIHKFGKFNTYGKFLITDTKINYAANLGYGHFLDYTMGGGADVRLSHRFTLRAIDFEYHYLPNYFGTTLQPMGVSAGLAYRLY
jgi:hypothetical protein